MDETSDQVLAEFVVMHAGRQVAEKLSEKCPSDGKICVLVMSGSAVLLNIGTPQARVKRYAQLSDGMTEEARDHSTRSERIRRLFQLAPTLCGASAPSSSNHEDRNYDLLCRSATAVASRELKDIVKGALRRLEALLPLRVGTQFFQLLMGTFYFVWMCPAEASRADDPISFASVCSLAQELAHLDWVEELLSSPGAAAVFEASPLAALNNVAIAVLHDMLVAHGVYEQLDPHSMSEFLTHAFVAFVGLLTDIVEALRSVVSALHAVAESDLPAMDQQTHALKEDLPALLSPASLGIAQAEAIRVGRALRNTAVISGVRKSEVLDVFPTHDFELFWSRADQSLCRRLLLLTS